MAGMLYRYQSDWLGPLLLAAALAWLFAESVLQARPIPALTKALRTALPLAVLAGVCYNFCVYFAAEPQLMGQNPAVPVLPKASTERLTSSPLKPPFSPLQTGNSASGVKQNTGAG